MKFVLLFILITATAAEPKQDVKCDGVHVRGKCHKKEVLSKGLNRPYQLSVYTPEHKIFFSYNIKEDTEDAFEIGYIAKREGHEGHDFERVTEVENGFATAVDHENEVVYLGGSEGIYRYHSKLNGNKTEKIIKGHNIWDMFYKNHLYFITFPSQKLYKYKHTSNISRVEHQEYIHEKIYQFAIDGDDDTFITNDTGLFRIKSGSDKRLHYKGVEKFRSIEVNHKGEVYFCGRNAIYVANKENNSLVEIAHIKNIFGLSFDKDNNIIYSDPHEIIKLLP